MPSDSILALDGLQHEARRGGWRLAGLRPGAGLALPALIVLVVFFVAPAATLLSYSVLSQAANGSIGRPLTLSHFAHLLNTPLYTGVLLVTLRISLLTAVLAAMAGFPAAMVIARGHPIMARLTTIVVIAPLVVSIVVRTYGWQLLLANNNASAVNWVLRALGLGTLRIMYSETAVVIGSLHVFLPMMVLPVASALSRIAPALEEAARTLGAPGFKVLLRVILPLSLPGLAAGFSLVFALTFSSFVTPAILGGNRATMLANLLEQQVTAVYDWPFAAAIALVMVLSVFAINAAAVWLLEAPAHQADETA